MHRLCEEHTHTWRRYSSHTDHKGRTSLPDRLSYNSVTTKIRHPLHAVLQRFVQPTAARIIDVFTIVRVINLNDERLAGGTARLHLHTRTGGHRVGCDTPDDCNGSS
jgi:hypothetical protein